MHLLGKTWICWDLGITSLSLVDRVLANVIWVQSYGSTSMDFLEAGVFDHSPTLIVVEQ
jgi:hypothetical protein